MLCEKCGVECERDEVDVGVGIIYGPWGCPCGWSEDSRYNSTEDEEGSPAQKENPDWLIDSRGGMIRKAAIEEKLKHFGINTDGLDL